MAAIILLASCAAKPVALEPNRIMTMRVSPLQSVTALCANDTATLFRVDVRYHGGDRLSTVRDGSGDQIRAGELLWKTTVGEITPEGQLIVPTDRLSWFDRPVTIEAAVARKPDLTHQVTLAPRYDCGLVSAAGGAGASDQPGAHGGRITVALTFVDLTGGRRWLLARVAGAGGPNYYVVDPGSGPPSTRSGLAGRFTIDVRGGAGGNGHEGAGGISGSNGSDGSSGTSGSTCGDGSDGGNGSDGGDGGNGSDGGNGGNGGDGGTVEVHFDARFPELTGMIDYLIDGGGPGAGGAGGAGGSGGNGGKGGSGGSAGSTDGGKCTTRSGRGGTDGRDGRDGGRGLDGAPGVAGRRGEVTARAVDVTTLFASELAAHLPVAGQ